MKLRSILLLLALGAAGTARADAPPMPLAQMEKVCSADHVICATIDRQHQMTTIRKGSAILWTMPSAPPTVAVTRDGDTLVERFRPGGVLDTNDGPETIVLVIRHRGTVVRRFRLDDLILHPEQLPTSVSHRRWSRTDYLLGGDYVVDTEEGKRVRISLSDGKITLQTLAGGTSDTWYCRYAQPTTTGPCAGPKGRH